MPRAPRPAAAAPRARGAAGPAERRDSGFPRPSPSPAPGAPRPAGPAPRASPPRPRPLTREQRRRAATRWDGAGAAGAARGGLEQRRGAPSAECVAVRCGGRPCTRRECERARETSGRAGGLREASSARGRTGKAAGTQSCLLAGPRSRQAGAAATAAAAGDRGSRGTWAAAPHEQQQRGRRWRRRRAGSEPELRRGSEAAGELRSGARREGRGPGPSCRDRGHASARAGRRVPTADAWVPDPASRPGRQPRPRFPAPESGFGARAFGPAVPPSGRRHPPPAHDF